MDQHQLCATALGVPFSHTAHGWRYLFMLGAVPSILQFVGCFWIVESPQWLVSKGRVPDAKVALTALRTGDSDVDTELELLQKEMTTVCEEEKKIVTLSLFHLVYVFDSDYEPISSYVIFDSDYEPFSILCIYSFVNTAEGHAYPPPKSSFCPLLYTSQGNSHRIVD